MAPVELVDGMSRLILAAQQGLNRSERRQRRGESRLERVMDEAPNSQDLLYERVSTWWSDQAGCSGSPGCTAVSEARPGMRSSG